MRALDALVPRQAPLEERLEERLELGRALVEANLGPALTSGPWADQAGVSAAEFVDRYLNVHETSYDVRGLFGLIEGAGLAFRPALEALCCLGENGQRLPLSPRRLGEPWLAWSPEASLGIARRRGRSSERIEAVELCIRRRPPLALSGACAQIALLLERQQEPLRALELMALAGEHGLDPQRAQRALGELLALEGLYRPHPVDL